MTLNDPAATPASDLAELRRSLRDVVALTMLPTVWAGYEPRQICADLVDVLARMVDADAVYLVSPKNGCAEILRLKRSGDREAETAVRVAAAEAEIGKRAAVTGTGQHVLQVMTASLSFQTDDRLVIAARRTDFPNDM